MNEYDCDEETPVTQEFDPIMDDPATYSIALLSNNNATPSALKAVSKVCGVNYIAAKNILANDRKTLFSGSAWETLEKKKLLDNGKVGYEISPDWPH